MIVSVILVLCGCLTRIGYVSSQGTQSFLELQRKLAEEQWQRDQAEAQNQDKDTGYDEEGEYYVYYYDDSLDESSSTIHSKETSVPATPSYHGERRKNRGFKQPVSTGLTKDITPYSIDVLIEEAKSLTQCLREGEEDPVLAAYNVNDISCNVKPTLGLILPFLNS